MVGIRFSFCFGFGFQALFFCKAFSLFFRGPADAPLPQATYALEHDELGKLEIFIVPVGRDEQGTDYEAAFN